MEKIDNSIYDQLGERWYTAHDDPVALLRAESKLRNPWVIRVLREQFSEKPARVLDLGCGAGFLSNELARAGFAVTGVDASVESIEVARRYDTAKTVNYVIGDANRLSFENETFDAVCAMDFLEHVEDPLRAIQEASRVLKPGGLFFFHTFNRNWISKFVAIRMVEWLVKNTPKNMHVHHMFITPKELSAYCEKSGMTVREFVGIKPKLFSRSVFRALFTGVVPEDFSFEFTKSLAVGYSGVATKKQSN